MATAALIISALSAVAVFVSVIWSVAGVWAKWQRRRLPTKSGTSAAACLLAAAGALASMAPLGAQSPAPTAAETRIYTEYIQWLSSLPPDQRGPDMAPKYRAALVAKGLPPAEVEKRLDIVDREGQRMEVARWNAFFTADTPRFNLAPNAFLIQIAERRTPGTALDAAMGQGRNAIWLARQGWQVTGFDPADQALDVAQRAAAALGLKLQTVNARFETFDFGENTWDLILLSYAGCTGGVVEKVEKGLKPGGIVVIEAFHEDAAKQFRIGGSICATGEPPQAFKHLRTVHFEEPIAMPDFGAQRMRLSRYVGEKPQP